MNAKIVIGVVIALVIVGIAGSYLSPRVTPHDSIRAEKPDLIVVDAPRIGDRISSPLTVSGRARGTWYFEASFPVRLVDQDGNNIPLTPPYITADGEWMTTEFVPFSAILTFTPPLSGTRGTLIFQKDNPSGLPEHDNSLEFPVVFR